MEQLMQLGVRPYKSHNLHVDGDRRIVAAHSDLNDIDAAYLSN